MAAASPGIFITGVNSQGTIVDLLGRIVDASASARAGDIVTIYCTGLGDVTNRPATGATSGLDDRLSTTLTPPTVTIGGLPGLVTFSGLTPGLVGLYQVNVQVPSGVAAGSAVPVVISVAGVPSNSATMSVR